MLLYTPLVIQGRYESSGKNIEAAVGIDSRWPRKNLEIFQSDSFEEISAGSSDWSTWLEVSIAVLMRGRQSSGLVLGTKKWLLTDLGESDQPTIDNYPWQKTFQ